MHSHSHSLAFIRLFFCTYLTLLFHFRVFLRNFCGTFARMFAKFRFADGAYRLRESAHVFGFNPNAALKQACARGGVSERGQYRCGGGLGGGSTRAET
jgi:hypothetical protein